MLILFVNTLSWSMSGIRHPELLEILRKADLVTADGMPLVWASKLLGKSLKERVTGADLVKDKNLLFVNQTIKTLQNSKYYLHPDIRVTNLRQDKKSSS